MRSGKKNPDLQRLSITGCASIINKTTPEKQTVLPGRFQQTSFSTHVFSYVTLRMSHSLFPGPGNVFQLLHSETCLLLESPPQHRGWQEVP